MAKSKKVVGASLGGKDFSVSEGPGSGVGGDEEHDRLLETLEAVRSVALFPEENPFPVARVDAEGKLLFANRASSELLAEWRCAVGGVVPDGVKEALEAGSAREQEARVGGRMMSFVLTPIGERGYVNLYGRDVTEERENAVRLAAFAEGTFEGVVQSESGRVVDCNEQFAQMVGYTVAELKGMAITELVCPEDRERVAASVLQGRDSIIEHGVLCKDGTRIVVEAHGRSVTPGSRRRHTAIRDITKRKRAEESLLAKEAELKSILTRTPFMLTRCSRDLRYRYASRSYAEMIGRTPEQVAGKPIIEIMGAAGFETIRPHVETVLRGENVEYEGAVDFAGVGPRWLRVQYVPERNEREEVIGWIGSIVDISERKRAEEALRERERQFRTLADSIPNLAWWANGDGYITWYNRRWYEYTGTTAEQMDGWGWQSVHDAEMLPRVLEGWRSSIATGEPFEMEFPLRGADGRFRWFLTRVVPVKDAEGKVARWFGTNTDVTEQREAREVLVRGHEELERLVQERTARLRELVGELEHFSYTLTHDLKSPLRAMRSFAEMMSLTCEGCDKGRSKEFLGRISTSAERMDHLIADALSYSRLVRQELPLEDVDAGALLRGMMDSYPELQPERARIRVEGRLPVVLANEAGLTQCFSNLLGNAVKFVKAGETPDIRVWASEVLAHGHHSGWVRIWVEDKGIGIGKETLPRVFEMFARGSKDYEGTGIGLALVRKVVQRMGGKVGVESEESKGSQFWIELKCGEAKQRGRQAEASSAAAGGAGTVLYVEDEESDAMFMGIAFEGKGLGRRLRVVGNGRLAIDYLSGAGEYADREKYPVPALVLLDLNLPQVPGFEVLEWMRNSPDYARTPVVVFSSSTREDDRVRAWELGANDFVPKPSSGMKFGEVVEQVRGKWMGRG